MPACSPSVGWGGVSRRGGRSGWTSWTTGLSPALSRPLSRGGPCSEPPLLPSNPTCPSMLWVLYPLLFSSLLLLSRSLSLSLSLLLSGGGLGLTS